MNWAQLHLALVHFPVVGAFFTLVILALAHRLRSMLLFRIGWGFTVFCAALAAASYFSGGEAFELLKFDLNKDVVEEHALIARGAFLLYALIGAVALTALLQEVQGDSVAGALRWVVTVGNLAVLTVLLRAAHLGGLIQHQEIARGIPLSVSAHVIR